MRISLFIPVYFHSYLVAQNMGSVLRKGFFDKNENRDNNDDSGVFPRK